MLATPGSIKYIFKKELFRKVVLDGGASPLRKDPPVTLTKKTTGGDVFPRPVFRIFGYSFVLTNPNLIKEAITSLLSFEGTFLRKPKDLL